MRENKLQVDFIKCDVEGAELFVFQGAIETLRDQKPVIFTEMLRKWAAKFNYHPNQIISLFTELGYQCYFSQENLLRKFSLMNDETEQTNFFFIHPERHKSLIQSLT
jgi:hypothetical protein